MTEALPRSFTVSTAAHALLVAVGLTVGSRVGPQHHRILTVPSAVLEIPLEVERPRAPAPPPPPPVAAPPPPPVRAAAAHRAPRIAPAPPAPAPPAPAPPAPAPPSASAPTAPAAPAPVITSEGGAAELATAPPGAASSASPNVATARSGTGQHVTETLAPQGPAFDAGAYLEGVTERVRRHRNYPAIAQEMGLEGTVEVRVVVAPDGTLLSPPTIDESCGHDVLDDEAIRIVRRAAPFPRMVGRSDRITLRVPVHFHLDT